MTEANKKGTWGGRRKGAGRPPKEIKSKPCTLRLAGDLAPYVESKGNKSQFINNCIRLAMRTEQALSKLGKVYHASELEDIKLPFFDIGIKAGFPIPLNNDERSQDINIMRMICPNPESCYLIRVNGDSMIDAGIYSGDIAIVDKSKRDPDESQVAVCELNGEYTLKRFVRRGDEGWLVPANPAYPEIKINEGDDFSIWGTVTYIIHRPGA